MEEEAGSGVLQQHMQLLAPDFAALTNAQPRSRRMPEQKYDLRERIDRDFRYHAPKEGQPERYAKIRASARALAHLIADEVPQSREQSLALTHLEECVMWANAGIARNE